MRHRLLKFHRILTSTYVHLRLSPLVLAALENFELSTRKVMSAGPDTKYRPPSQTSGTSRGNVVDHNEPHGTHSLSYLNTRRYVLAATIVAAYESSFNVCHELTLA